MPEPDADPATPIPRAPSCLKRLLQRLALLIGTLLLLLVVGEIVLRLAGVPPRTPSVIQGYFQWHPKVGWVGRPHAAQRFVTTEFDVWVSHDEDGLRRCALTSRIGEDASSATPVVWCVGDSTTWGWGVEDGATWVEALDGLDGGRSYRNLGAPGYGTVQAYRLLEDRFARGDRPAAVLLLLCANDYAENIETKQSRPYVVVERGEARFVNTEVAKSHWTSVRAWLVNNLLVCNHLHFYFMLARQRLEGSGEGPVAPTTPAAAAPGLPADQVTAMRFVCAHLRDLCARHAVTLCMATPHDDAAFEAICGELDLPCVSLAPHLRLHGEGADGGSGLYLGRDRHWSERGNRVVAQGLYAAVRSLPVR